MAGFLEHGKAAVDGGLFETSYDEVRGAVSHDADYGLVDDPIGVVESFVYPDGVE